MIVTNPKKYLTPDINILAQIMEMRICMVGSGCMFETLLMLAELKR